MKNLVKLFFVLGIFHCPVHSFSQSEEKALSQRILLDQITPAGPLKLFPGFEGSKNEYRYLPNKLRLATQDDGTPAFSFLWYVENKRSGADEKEIAEGEGGGYVHVLIELKVLPEELQQATQALKKTNPNGKIVGPVIYTGGTMELVCALLNEDNKKTVLGIGPAPSLEGDKVAVSFVLDKRGAKLLYESLKSSTPQISFNLNMTMRGYQSPVEFKIEIEWDKVYKHKIFNAGVAGNVAGIVSAAAEIGIAVQEMKESGAIKVTNIGEDVNVQRMEEVLFNKIIEACFVPLGAEGGVNWSELAKPLNDGKSYLDRATDGLNQEREATRNENARIRQENRQETRYSQDENRRIRAENRQNSNTAEQQPSTGTQTAQNSQEQGATGASGSQSTLFDACPSDVPVPIPPYNPDPGSNTAAPGYSPSLQNQELPALVKVTASYQQKTIRQTGRYVAEAKSYFTTSLTERFGSNIGNISCPSCIQKINLYDPLYQQREIVAFIDGLNAEDFGKYINFVTVSMRKKHPGGETTTDDVRIDRNNFNKQGNNFKLMYGWMKGDDNRKSWLDYEYKTSWSFFGGGTIDEDWKKSNIPALNVAPPLQRRIITVQGDPSLMNQSGIRVVNIKFYYLLAGQEQVKQVSLNPSKDLTSTAVEFMLPKNKLDYDYEIVWTMNDNETIKSARKNSDNSDLFVDVLPKK